MAQWVMHKSGQGEKWEVIVECDEEFRVHAKHKPTDWHALPKSEYLPCEPPEQWEPVDTKVDSCGNLVSYITANNDNIGYIHFDMSGYRVRSLVVERRKG